jgi:hypothetical protein
MQDQASDAEMVLGLLFTAGLALAVLSGIVQKIYAKTPAGKARRKAERDAYERESAARAAVARAAREREAETVRQRREAATRVRPAPAAPPRSAMTAASPQANRYGVYEARDGDNRLIYVGISNGLMRRWREHLGTKPWSDEVEAMSVVAKNLSEAEARAMERQLIRAKRPKYNIQHNRPRRSHSYARRSR